MHEVVGEVSFSYRGRFVCAKNPMTHKSGSLDSVDGPQYTYRHRNTHSKQCSAFDPMANEIKPKRKPPPTLTIIRFMTIFYVWCRANHKYMWKKQSTRTYSLCDLADYRGEKHSHIGQRIYIV